LGTKAGINFIRVSVTELHFKLNRKFKLPKEGIPVDMEFDIKKMFSRDKKSLTTILSAKLFQKIKKNPFKMNVTIEGIFISNDIKELQNFSNVHAPAHLMPFLREVVGNTTMKANIPPLLLPPLNVSDMIGEDKRK